MFNVRRRGTEEILQVLDVYMDDVSGVTFFFVWENDDWRWRPANNFVPPNYKGDRE